MEEIKRIADLYYQESANISTIAEITKHDRKTIRQHLTDKRWLSAPPTVTEHKTTKLTPFIGIIDGWLEDDRKARHKQRHTAKRVFDRLKAEQSTTFNCSYRTVASYVKARKKVIFPGRDGSLPLTHYAGAAQVDFGSADFHENGILHSGHYLTLSLPYSNSGYMQLFKGENLECLLTGMQNIFNHLGGVPYRIVFDNASTMVASIDKEGKRKLTDAFYRFSLNYGFAIDFCNPASGNEKGSVESKVGYLRRNILVPVPEFQNIEDYNKELLVLCDQDNQREHYVKGEAIDKLQIEDKKKFFNLPNSEYEVASYEKVRVNGYGKFTLNSGKHIYSSAPKYSGSAVTVKITAHYVDVLDESFKLVVRHKRLYGKPAESMNWQPYLTQLAIKPKAIKYTDIMTLLPQPVQDFFNSSDSRKDDSNIMHALAEITNKSSFETGIKVIEQAVIYKCYDIESIRSIYKRMSNQTMELPTITTPESVPNLTPIKINTSIYDNLLLRKEVDSVS